MLPVVYAANKKAWMTSDIFQQYVSKWNNELRRKNKKILLLVDNCLTNITNLTNIKLMFLPPNATSVLQPMDMGFKVYFRRFLVLQLIDRRERGLHDIVSLLDSISLMKDAWDTFTPATVIDCFRKSGLSSG
jgi:4-diphosphocytidyl-2C-methyl-D-erythritol kinase